EGVGRQRHPAAPLAGREALPVRNRPTLPEAAQGGEQEGLVGARLAVVAQRGYDHLARPARRVLADEGAERLSRADLDEEARRGTRRSSSATASGGPATTERPGPLSAASDRPGKSGSRASISAAGSGMASIAPGGRASISRARAATRARASSNEKTPARQA